MMKQAYSPQPIHQGRNVKRFREIAGLKQEALADILGQEWSHKKVSTIEGIDIIEDSLLIELSKALNIPVNAIKYLQEDGVMNIINNNFHDFHNSNAINYNCTINSFDEVKTLIAENLELTKELLKTKDEKIAVLERMDELTQALLKEKEEKIALLQKLLNKKDD